MRTGTRKGRSGTSYIEKIGGAVWVDGVKRYEPGADISVRVKLDAPRAAGWGSTETWGANDGETLTIAITSAADLNDARISDATRAEILRLLETP